MLCFHLHLLSIFLEDMMANIGRYTRVSSAVFGSCQVVPSPISVPRAWLAKWPSGVESASQLEHQLVELPVKAIPKKFATNVRGQISEEVKLEVPNGNTYNVKVDVEQNDLIIGPGWATFSSAYDLKSGDFLVFTYSGHSHFKVRIFDPSGCEKEFSCVPMDGIPCVQERSVSQGNHKQSPTREKLVKRCIGSSGQSRKTLKMSPTDSPSEKTTEIVPSSEGIEEPMNSGGFQKSTKCCFVLPSGCSMTNEQKARINTLIKKIRPQVPLYITTIDKTTVAGGFLAISKDYAIKYLLDANGSSKLSQLDGVKIWAINLDINTGSLYALSTGWMDFIRDNKLQDGDICIFQPSKGKKGVTLIFHPLEESCCPQLPGFVPSAKSPGMEFLRASPMYGTNLVLLTRLTII